MKQKIIIPSVIAIVTLAIVGFVSIGMMDENGYTIISDRKKDMVNVGGLRHTRGKLKTSSLSTPR